MPARSHAPRGADDWERGLAALERFVAARGTARVPSRAIAGGVAVGAWATKMRERYWGAELPPEQVRRLEALPGWTWSGPAEQKWHRALRALSRYVDDRGTTELPPTTVVGEIRLGAWVAAQRAGYAAGTLAPPNAAALEAVPGWRWQTEDDRWQRGFAALLGYVSRNGTADVPSGAVVDGFPLGAWLQARRAEHRAGTLSSERIAALEILPGWRWMLSMHRWEQGLGALRRYVAEHGSADPPQHARVGGFPVGQWAHARRREHAAGALTPERAAALEALPGWLWDVRGGRWEAGLAHLRRFVEAHGHACPAEDTVLDGFRLGRWVRGQRRAHRLGRLSAEQMEVLESLPGWRWSVS